MRKQIEDYIAVLNRDIPVVVYEILLLLLCFGTIVFIACYGLKRGWRKVASLILVEYVFLIISSTVIYRTDENAIGNNFMPFWSYLEIWYEGAKSLIAENVMYILAFVPIGFLLGVVVKNLRSITMNAFLVALIGCGISLSVESMQFFLKRGFAETDDVMHNTFGCLIGYILAQCSQIMLKGKGLSKLQ